ncbi:MAG: LysM peptidoglycan-binding domain-containing protein [Oscillospiraceae bacterium]|nr:LysM peptidoglycan-binding domain-containing protein [Oscillospiraceae bacterium]
MMYIFYLDGVPLPVTPSKVKTKIRNKNKTVDLVNGSELNLLKLPGLTEIEFNALLPLHRYPFSIYRGQHFQSPKYYLDLLEGLKTRRKAFEFYIMRVNDLATTDAFNTSMPVTLEEYSFTEDANDGGDITVTISLKQYNAQGTKTITVNENGEICTSEESARDGERQKPTLYTVQEGDTLWEIAQNYYGDGERWSEIYANNKYILETAAIAAGNRDAFGGLMIIPGTVIEL